MHYKVYKYGVKFGRVADICILFFHTSMCFLSFDNYRVTYITDNWYMQEYILHPS